MVKTFQAYLSPQCHRKYSCIHCRAHLANHDELISKVRPLFLAKIESVLEESHVYVPVRDNDSHVDFEM